MNLRSLVPIGLMLLMASCRGEGAAPAGGRGNTEAEAATPSATAPDTLPADTIMPRDTAQP
jgi:hypothetical protein